MKLVSTLAFLAALAVAATVLPLPSEVVAYFVFTAALGCVWAQDYSCRRSLRFEVTGPKADELAARFFFHRLTATPRVTFRAPALAAESNRLAA